MKNVKTIILAACALAAAASCNKNITTGPHAATAEEGPYGSISISIVPDTGTETKATPYVTADGQEKRIDDYQILIFRSTGELARYISGSPGVTTGYAALPSIRIPVGLYNIYAVVNGPSAAGVSSEDELKDLSAPLATYNSATKLVQFGSTPCTVNDDETVEIQVNVTRLVARIHLQSVKNMLPAVYGSITLKHAFLANVVANETLGCTDSPDEWYNQYGRTSAETPAIIDGVSNKADAEDITFKSKNVSIASGATISNVLDLYCYKNSMVSTPEVYSIDFSPSATLCVLTMEIGGQTYYYPINIASSVADPHRISPNNSYSMAVTITNLGSSDPALPVITNSLEISIGVSPWGNGGAADVEL